VSVLAATSGSKLLWYLARGSGLAALVVLTLSVVLGIVTSVRWTNPRWPRFVIELLHRNSSLLAFALIVVHVSTVVIDAFAPIGWKDIVFPFVSVYRPFWLGVGTVAFDLLIALLVTSLLRHRVGHRTWRVVHWFAYLCWPLVVLHGLGAGSDTQVGLVLMLNVACVGAVILALWWRLATGWPDRVGVRVSALLASIMAPILLLVWLASGPLAAGWARRAGTPASLLVHVSSTPTTAAPPASSGAAAGSSTLASAPFSATLSGSISESSPAADGRVTVRLATTMTGGAAGVLEVDLTGPALDGGGVLLDSSVVALGPATQPTLYQGAVRSLRGTEIVATVRSSGRPALQLTIAAQPDPTGTRVTGSLRANLGGDAR
jgi:sulfoxide reductase heme-binding subunit YedZ